MKSLRDRLRPIASALQGGDRLAVLEAMSELETQREKRSAEYYGCMYYFLENPVVSIAGLRELNASGVWWAYCLLYAIDEARVSIDRHPDAIVRKAIRTRDIDGERAVCLEYDVIEDGRLLCSVAWAGIDEDEPRFVVTAFRAAPEWCEDDWGGTSPPWLLRPMHTQ